MNPEELASRYPCLYHITEPGAGDTIKQHGLLSTRTILDLYQIDGLDRTYIEQHKTARRGHKTFTPLLRYSFSD